MTPDHPLIPNAIEPAFWHSKKFVAAMIHHVLVWSGVVFGGVIDPHTLTMSIPAAIASSTTVTVGQNVSQAAVDRAQAYSPNYPNVPPTIPPAGPRAP